MRRQLARGGQPLRVTDNMACGAYGGICQAPIANVIELLKVRLQVQGASSQPLNMRQVFLQVWNSGGFYSLSRGLLPLMIRDAVGYGWYQEGCSSPQSHGNRHVWRCLLLGPGHAFRYR